MAHYLTNNEKFHIFSKSPVLSSMAVSQAVNKSGHTVSTNDVWADDVPWFTEVADEAGAITRAADARYNDLILWGSDIYVRKGDKTNGASTGTTFAELWEKHTDLTEARAYALGSVTTQTPTNIVTKTVEIKNASDKVVLKYHVGKQIDLLTTANNANVASTWAARMFIDGKVVDQFVSPTDKVFAGNPSTGYTTLVYTATAPDKKYGFVAEGEADGDFVNNAFAGIVQFNQSRNSGHKFAASVFEYVGDKLDATVAKLNAAVFGSGSTGGEDQPVDLVTQVNLNTAAIATLNGDANTVGSVAKAVADAKDYTDTAIATELDEGGSIAQAIATAKEQAIANAKVTLTAGNGITIPNSGTQDTAFTISVDTEVIATKASVEKVSDAVTGVSQTVSSIQTELSTGSIATGISEAKAAAQAAQTTADEAKATADTAVQSVTRAAGSSDLITVTDGTDVTISLSTEVATKTYVSEQASAAQTAAEQTAAGALNDAKTEIKGTTDALAGRLTTAEGKVTVLEGQVAALTTGENSVDSKIQTAVDAITETTDAISEAVEGVKATADTAVQTASGDDYVSAAKEADSTNIKVTTNIDAIASAVDAALVKDGTAVATAIAGAATAGTDAADALADTAITEQSVSGSGISVTLGGKVGTPTLTGSVTTSSYADGVWTDGEKVATGSTVAAAIKDVDDKINTLHSTAVTYKVYETKPEASEELKGIIALVPAGEGDSAVAGSYIEWLCVESVAEDGSKSYSWERIGTTAADFTQYAKTADLKVDETTVNGLTYSQTNGLVSASVAKASTTQVGTVQLTDTYSSTDSTNAATGTAIAAAIATLDATEVGSGAVKVSQTDGVVDSVTVETESLVSEGAIIDATTSTTALVTAADALEAIKLAKPENYVASVTGYTTTGEEVTTTQGAALTIKDDRETVYENDLWGTSVTLDGNVLTVSHNKLSNPKGSSGAWIEGITKVEDNKAYNGDTVVANIQTEMIKDGSYMFYWTNLSEFSSDLPSLTNGTYMFHYSNLKSFSSDLPSLTNGQSMFDSCSQLTTFASDLPSLTNGKSMFSTCDKLTSFCGDLCSLTNGQSMFSTCDKLTSFCGDLCSLTNGNKMFYQCSQLTSFCGDLSSLETGVEMFYYTKLDVESVECIADVIKSWGVYGEDGSLTGTSDEKVHHITIDVADTASTEIAKSIEEIAQKGWTVATNHTAFAATSAIDGDKPAANFMIAHPATEDNATFVDAAGNFFTIETAVSVIGIGQSEWSIFASIEDAIAEWGLTPYEKA